MRSIRRIPWLMTMLRPKKAMEALFRMENPGYQALPMLLGGILLMQFWADLFNMGLRYDAGLILSVSLVLGPVWGLVWLFSAAGMSNLMGRWLLRSDPAAAAEQRYFKPTFARHAIAILNAGGPLLLMAPVALLELMLVPQSPFQPGHGHVFFLAFKIACILGHALLCWVVFDIGYTAPRRRKVLAFGLAWMLALGICLGTASLFGLPIF